MTSHSDHVRQERLQRTWSVRDAARQGGISNTYWGEFEDYKRKLTPMIAEAVAKAFDWPADWADRLSGANPPAAPDLEARVAALELAVRELGRARLGDDPAAGTTRAGRSKPAARKPRQGSR